MFFKAIGWGGRETIFYLAKSVEHTNGTRLEAFSTMHLNFGKFE